MGKFVNEEKLTAWDVKALLLSVEKAMEFGLLDGSAGGTDLLTTLRQSKSIMIERFKTP